MPIKYIQIYIRSYTIISRVIKKVKDAFSPTDTKKPSLLLKPNVLSRGEHGISRTGISDNALKVLYRLNSAGYEAYLVGGCVRDLMMGLQPKDFDVATNATPDQVKAEFRNCRLIGRRFRLAHVVYGREIIEVATFRGHHANAEEQNAKTDKDKPEQLGKQDQQGQILRDNVFGTIQEDAERRDFTVNAMYYRVTDFTVTDFADGISSIKNKRLEIIGDPDTRYREDPVRMLRAVRFAVKLNMTVSEESAESIMRLNGLLSNIPPARLFEEVLKLFVNGSGLETFKLMQKFGLLAPLFPQLTPLLSDPQSRESQFIQQVLINTDNRINTGQRVTPAFLYAAFLWYPIEEHCEKLVSEAGLLHFEAFNIACNDVLHRQIQRIMIPKRFSSTMREMWQLQLRLPKRFGKRAYQNLEHPRFRAAYDFLLLRGQIEGGKLLELADWWTEFQSVSEEQRKTMLSELRDEESGGANRRRRRKPRKKPSA